MKIKALRLRDFKGLDDLKMSFDGRSTVIFGINGAGKSSILHGIALVYANILSKLTGMKKLADFTEDDISYGKSTAFIEIVFSFPEGEEITYTVTVERGSVKKQRVTGLKEMLAVFSQTYTDTGTKHADGPGGVPKNMPVFAHYGVNRLVADVPVKVTDRDHFTRMGAFEKAIESKIDFRSLFQWFRNQEDIENQEKVRSFSGYEDRSLAAVRKAMLSMLDGFGDIHIDRHPMAMKVKKDGQYLKISQLSDGEKCTIALFGDLARRMALANPGLSSPLDGQGVVLIDELDLHMHTTWQRKVMNVLRNTFPDVQFIVTTHSPQILGETDDACGLWFMARDGQNVSLRSYRSFIGWDANVILEEVMGTPSVHHRIKELLAEMYGYIESRDYDRAEAAADLLDELSGGYADGVTKARVLISRGRRREQSGGD